MRHGASVTLQQQQFQRLQQLCATGFQQQHRLHSAELFQGSSDASANTSKWSPKLTMGNAEEHDSSMRAVLTHEGCGMHSISRLIGFLC